PAPQTMAQPAPAPAPPSATVRANPAVDAPVAMSQRPALAQAAPLPSPPAAHLQFANRRALVIGNDNYRSVDPLKNAVSDARAMATALERSGYKVSLHLDLDEKRFKQALRTFRYEVQGGDEVMFFFAGHGVEIAGANFLLPVDIRVSGTDNDKDRDQLREDSIDLKRFMSDLEERKTKFALAVIDACREDPFPKEKGSRSISTKGGLAQTTPATGQMIIFSAGAGQLAIDSLGANDPSKNGLFTRVFLSEMDKPGVPVDRVLKNVRTEVSRLAKTMGRTQTPAIYDQSEGDFYFRLR
ncbi:MAG: caspase family protein, partial [Betaproteobacteria bacterium]|nr:caspase family protein [Betaproteobacteria bacterium]